MSTELIAEINALRLTLNEFISSHVILKKNILMLEDNIKFLTTDREKVNERESQDEKRD